MPESTNYRVTEKGTEYLEQRRAAGNEQKQHDTSLRDGSYQAARYRVTEKGEEYLREKQQENQDGE